FEKIYHPSQIRKVDIRLASHMVGVRKIAEAYSYRGWVYSYWVTKEDIMNVEEVIIVGSGSCGMSTHVQLQEHRINQIIIEKGNIVNSIYSYPTHKTFFSSSDKLEIGDMPFISAKHKPVRIEALAYYREVAKRNKLRINAFETVQDISKKDNLFTVKTINQFDEEVFYKTKYVILATGYYDQPNFLNIPGSSL